MTIALAEDVEDFLEEQACLPMWLSIVLAWLEARQRTRRTFAGQHGQKFLIRHQQRLTSFRVRTQVTWIEPQPQSFFRTGEHRLTQPPRGDANHVKLLRACSTRQSVVILHRPSSRSTREMGQAAESLQHRPNALISSSHCFRRRRLRAAQKVWLVGSSMTVAAASRIFPGPNTRRPVRLRNSKTEVRFHVPGTATAVCMTFQPLERDTLCCSTAQQLQPRAKSKQPSGPQAQTLKRWPGSAKRRCCCLATPSVNSSGIRPTQRNLSRERPRSLKGPPAPCRSTAPPRSPPDP